MFVERTPLDLNLYGYTRRRTILFQDCFDFFAKIGYSQVYDLDSVSTGNGTNNITDRKSHISLAPGATAGYMEGNRSLEPIGVRALRPRLEIKTEFASLTQITFSFGFWKSSDEYVYIQYDSGAENNEFYMIINNNSNISLARSGITPVIDTSYILELWVDSSNRMRWAINHKNISNIPSGIIGSGDYHFEFWLKTKENVAKLVAIDYLEFEKFKELYGT